MVMLYSGWLSVLTVVDDERGKVGNRRHDALDDAPGESAAMDGVRLVHDRSDPVRLDDGPDEEGDSGDRHDVCLYGEEMADLMHRWVDRRQRDEPEDEEAEKVARVRARRRRESIRKLLVLGPDGPDHEVHARPADERLHAVPDAGHGGAVEDGPEGPPDSKGGPRHDRKGDVVGGADAAGETDEACGNGVPDPHADPRLPPGEPGDDHG